MPRATETGPSAGSSLLRGVPDRSPGRGSGSFLLDGAAGFPRVSQSSCFTLWSQLYPKAAFCRTPGVHKRRRAPLVCTMSGPSRPLSGAPLPHQGRETTIEGRFRALPAGADTIASPDALQPAPCDHHPLKPWPLGLAWLTVQRHLLAVASPGPHFPSEGDSVPSEEARMRTW